MYIHGFVGTEAKELHRIACDLGRQCLARRARILSRKLTRIYDDALRPLGLTSCQLGILGAIAATRGARATDLHRWLELEQSSFSRNTALMERRGWIEKRPAEDDRCQELVLTRAGSALLAKAIPRWRTAQRQAKRLLGEDAQAFADLVDERC
jgi:DNA-binding MarR family transcriptional regulator